MLVKSKFPKTFLILPKSLIGQSLNETLPLIISTPPVDVTPELKQASPLILFTFWLKN